MLNAAVVGMGVGYKHAEAYSKHPKTKFSGFFDFKDLRNISFAKDVKIYKSFNEIIEDESIDIISVASYDNFHANQIIMGIESGKHIMSEKPLCLNDHELKKIYKTLSENPEIKISANHVLRANSRFKKIKNLINSDNLGDLFYIEGDYLWGRKEKLYQWRSKMDFYSIILGAAIHMIDLIMWMTKSKPVSVYAIGNKISTYNSTLNYNSFALLNLIFENGLIAKITGNGGCIHPHFHALKIFGTKKSIEQNINGSYYINSSNPGVELEKINEPYPEKHTREKVIHSFVDSILDSNLYPLVTKNDVFDVTSVCLAAEKSMKDNRPTKIDYLTV